MPKADPIGGSRGEAKGGSTSQGRDVPVAGLLRDSIVGITCFPDPLPRGRRRKSRRRWRDANRP